MPITVAPCAGRTSRFVVHCLRNQTFPEVQLATATQGIVAEGCEHVVQFYESQSGLAAAVCPYLGAALAAGDAAVVIATADHRRAFESELEEDGVDLGAAAADGRYISVDASELMDAFIVRGEIDATGFHEVMGGILRAAAGSGRAVRVYGEMVALLWDAGDVLGAIELETLWNELARELPFSLVCAYPAASVAGSQNTEALQQMCHLHSSVLGSMPGARASAAARPTELSAEFPLSRDAPGRARHLLSGSLEQAGHDETFIAHAALVLTELASNAVLHARSPFSLAVTSERSTLRIAVEDRLPLDGAAAQSADGALVARPAHGLGLIDALSTRWGVERTARGKVVWAELSAQTSG
jgi:anti-sigma regulatory factor (Ser/Thr protein kinase)